MTPELTNVVVPAGCITVKFPPKGMLVLAECTDATNGTIKFTAATEIVEASGKIIFGCPIPMACAPTGGEIAISRTVTLGFPRKTKIDEHEENVGVSGTLGFKLGMMRGSDDHLIVITSTIFARVDISFGLLASGHCEVRGVVTIEDLDVTTGSTKSVRVQLFLEVTVNFLGITAVITITLMDTGSWGTPTFPPWEWLVDAMTPALTPIASGMEEEILDTGTVDVDHIGQYVR